MIKLTRNTLHAADVHLDPLAISGVAGGKFDGAATSVYLGHNEILVNEDPMWIMKQIRKAAKEEDYAE